MKKLVTLFAFAAIIAGAVSAQDVTIPKRNYINLAFATQELKPAEDGFDGDGLKSDMGLAAEFGRTFFFNGRKPIAGMVRIGIDWSYLDLQYASFKQEFGDESIDSHFANIGMQFGPSVTVTPFEKLNLKAYIRYAPSFAAFSPESWDNVKFGYAGYITGGVQASYRFITLGVELRSCKAKMSNINIEDIEEIEDLGDISGPKVKVKLPSTRFIVGFRF